MHKGKISKTMQYLPFVFMGIMMCIIHSRIGLDTADDVWFENQVKAPGFNLGQWLYIRYYIWSSRTIIEAIMLFVLSLPQLIWRILDSAMFVLTAMFMSKNFCTEEHIVLKNWLIVFLNLTVNLKVMSEAGWGAATMNYVWPLAMALVAVYSIRKVYDKKKMKALEYIVYSICLLFAANMEQLSIVLLITFGTANFVYWLENKKISKYLIVQLGVVLLDLVWILYCPGNEARQMQETQRWYPIFENFGVLKKAELGISNTLTVAFLRDDLWILILTMIICLAVWNKYQNWFYRLLGTGLFVIVAVLQYFYSICGETRMPYDLMSNRGLIRPETMYAEKVWLIYFGLLFLCCLILIDFYIIYQESLQMLITAGIFLMGMMTKAMMGFSPTIWVSLHRTEWIMIYAMLCCCVILINSVDYKKIKTTIVLLLIVIPYGIIGLSNMLHI